MSTGVIALAIPILALMIPIIALLVQHQQKMTQILHAQRSDHALEGEVARLAQEVKELKELVHQHLLALDDHRPPQIGGS